MELTTVDGTVYQVIANQPDVELRNPVLHVHPADHPALRHAHLVDETGLVADIHENVTPHQIRVLASTLNARIVHA